MSYSQRGESTVRDVPLPHSPPPPPKGWQLEKWKYVGYSRYTQDRYETYPPQDVLCSYYVQYCLYYLSFWTLILVPLYKIKST
jgi:hypothetical protein